MMGVQAGLRITRTSAEELNASSLNTALLSGRPLRVLLIPIGLCLFSIVTRITVYQDTNHAELLSTLDLEAPENAAVFRNGDLALEIDISFYQILIIPVGAVVDIDELPRYIAAGRVSVERWNPIVERCGGVFIQYVFSK